MKWKKLISRFLVTAGACLLLSTAKLLIYFCKSKIHALCMYIHIYYIKKYMLYVCTYIYTISKNICFMYVHTYILYQKIYALCMYIHIYYIALQSVITSSLDFKSYCAIALFGPWYKMMTVPSCATQDSAWLFLNAIEPTYAHLEIQQIYKLLQVYYWPC